MADTKQLFSLLTQAATTLAPMIVPGAGPLIGVAKSLGEAFSGLKQANGGQAPIGAERAHSALYEKVKAHADDTLGRLESG